ncbi:MAG: radical SAM protein [Candidatus Bathyarchaeia archaeon]
MLSLKSFIGEYIKFRTNRIVPRLFLFPITSRCNSRCVMCNIWRQKETSELTLKQIRKMLDDPVFKSVEQVVISGGEPTLRDDISSIINLLVENCPSLRYISMCTNGLVPERVIKAWYALNEVRKRSNVNFSFSVSLDGLNEVHGKVRGVPDAFERTVETINALIKLKQKSDFGLYAHCVITNANVYGLFELKRWCYQKNLAFSFELAHEWKRFLNKDSTFHLNKEQKMAFLHALWNQVKFSGTEYYWMCYRMLRCGKKRHLTCPFVISAFSVHPDGAVYYCPSAESIGNILKDNLSNIYYSKANLEYRNQVKKNKCPTCTQSFGYYIETENILHHMQYRIIKRIMSLTR